MKNFAATTCKLNDLCLSMGASAHANFQDTPMTVTFENEEGSLMEFEMDENFVITISSSWVITDADLNKIKKTAQEFMIAYLMEYFVYMKIKKQPPQATFTLGAKE